jgi:hypothetical protein
VAAGASGEAVAVEAAEDHVRARVSLRLSWMSTDRAS